MQAVVSEVGMAGAAAAAVEAVARWEEVALGCFGQLLRVVLRFCEVCRGAPECVLSEEG